MLCFSECQSRLHITRREILDKALSDWLSLEVRVGSLEINCTSDTPEAILLAKIPIMSG